MSPRISFWTGWLDPQMVAVSKEVFQLLRRFPGSRAFGISPHYLMRMSLADRSFGVHPGLYPLFRRAIPHLEHRFDVSHVYTSLGDWHFLSSLGRRPIVLTLTQQGEAAEPELLAKVAHVAAESEPLAGAAIAAGVSADRVSVIYPGVDLELFRDSPPPGRPWKLLFASSPENPAEIGTKGVDLLMDLAASEPELEITMLWRPFGKGSDRALELVRGRDLPNLRVVEGRIGEIHRLYGRHHAVVAPFRTVGKPCPNSILEGLACGRPALVSRYVDIAGLLEREGCGVAFEPTAEGIASAFRELVGRYDELRPGARPCAERHFNLERTVSSYRAIYRRDS